MQSERKGLSYIRYPVVKDYLLKKFSSSACLFSNFISCGVAVVTTTYIWVLCSIPLINMSVTVSVSCCFDYYSSLLIFDFFNSIVFIVLLLIDTRFYFFVVSLQDKIGNYNFSFFLTVFFFYFSSCFFFPSCDIGEESRNMTRWWNKHCVNAFSPPSCSR